MTGAERRRAIARIRAQVERGHGCTHFEALHMLSYLDQLQEQLIVIYASEEWALAAMDRRFNAGDRTETTGRGACGSQGRADAGDGVDRRWAHQGRNHGAEVVLGHAPRVEGGAE